MKYIARENMRVGGVQYPAGSIVEIMGREQMQVFGDKLLPITNAEMIRAIAVAAHPMLVLAPFTWGRRAYEPGSIFWATTRSELRHLPGEALRPATGDEVLQWFQNGQGVLGHATAETAQPSYPIERVEDDEREPEPLAHGPVDPRPKSRLRR